MMGVGQTLGELVAAHPAAARILHRHRMDYCCGGEESLAAACAARGLSVDAVLREIGAAAEEHVEEVRWTERPLAELVQHIVLRYHASLRTEIPRLIDLAAKVEQAHADKPERPQGLAALLGEVHAAVEEHLAKEEQILFPLIVAGRGAMAHMPVQMMIQEHEDHGQSLRRIRELTRDFRVPAEACATWRELYRSLARFEVELMDHIHLENHVLFPRALAG